MNILGIIPARGGSKRILRKNIKEIAGKPLIYWTIKAAQASRCLSELIVSSDDDEIIEYAVNQGIKAPFKRPAYLSTDTASSFDVVIHALNMMQTATSVKYEYVCLLEPTSPLKRSVDIDAAIDKLVNSGCDSLLSLIPADCGTPYRIRYIENNEVSLPFADEFYDYMKNKSKYPKAYIPGGGIFCTRADSLSRHKSLMAGKVMPYVMDRRFGLDINEMDDFVIAQCLLEKELEMKGEQ